MPNQANFGNPIRDMSAERMIRPTVSDQSLVKNGDKTIIFGTNPNDNIELWFYNPDGTYASNIRLSVEDPNISLSTVLSNSGSLEFLNLDLVSVAREANLPNGRYAISIYFLRDEIGSQEGEKLYVTDISPSRTEVVLSDISSSNNLSNEIYEFVTPSVPKLYAKGLVDEIFGKSKSAPASSSIDIFDISAAPNMRHSIERIGRASAVVSFESLFKTILSQSYDAVVNSLISSSQLYNVQSSELQSFVNNAISTTIAQMVRSNKVDPRFILV